MKKDWFICLVCALVCALLFVAGCGTLSYTGKVETVVPVPKREDGMKFYIRSFRIKRLYGLSLRVDKMINENGTLRLDETATPWQKSNFAQGHKEHWQTIINELHLHYGDLFVKTPQEAIPIDFNVEYDKWESGDGNLLLLNFMNTISLGLVPVYNYATETWSVTARVDSLTSRTSTDVKIRVGGADFLGVVLRNHHWFLDFSNSDWSEHNAPRTTEMQLTHPKMLALFASAVANLDAEEVRKLHREKYAAPVELLNE